MTPLFCIWFPVVLEGVRPWGLPSHAEGSGTGSEIAITVYSSGLLMLEMESTDDQIDQADLYITVSPSGDDCFLL